MPFHSETDPSTALAETPSTPPWGPVTACEPGSALDASYLLEAPAGKVWHLEFDNQSTTLHNFALSSGSNQIFKTETFGHGIQTIDVPGLPADTYLEAVGEETD